MSSTPRMTPYGYDQEFDCVLNTSKDQITYYDTNGKVFMQENLAKDRFGRRYVKEQIEFGDTIIKGGNYPYQERFDKYKSFHPNGNPEIIGTKNYSNNFVREYVEYWPNKEPKTVSFNGKPREQPIGTVFRFRRNGKVKSIDGPNGIITIPVFSLKESFVENFSNLFRRQKKLDHYANSAEMLRTEYAYKQITAAMKIRHQCKQLIS